MRAWLRSVYQWGGTARASWFLLGLFTMSLVFAIHAVDVVKIVVFTVLIVSEIFILRTRTRTERALA